jgi:hypothetical protein
MVENPGGPRGKGDARSEKIATVLGMTKAIRKASRKRATTTVGKG